MALMRWTRLVGLVFLCALLGVHAGAVDPAAAAGGRRQPPGAVALDPRLPVHPYLQYGAHVEPERRVRVIVQKTGPGVSSAALARAAGGRVVEEFPFIDAALLEMAQRATLALGRQPGVRAVTYDASVRKHAIADDALRTTYPAALGLPQLWNGPLPATGRGVTVAVVDTGVAADHPDLAGRTLVVATNRDGKADDGYGHGTHVAGVIAGRDAAGRYLGVAPEARLIGVRIADDAGRSTEADLLRGLAWVHAQRQRQTIRVVNLSLSVSLPTSPAMSPVAAAVERLWRDGVVVVAAAGNRGDAPDAAWYPPGNDAFVITAGALDHAGTADPADDRLAEFSGRGMTQDGQAKPDLVAPGRRIVAPLAGPGAVLARQLPERITDGRYLRLSGTSMATSMVAGVAALLLERFPHLTPDQVKWLLVTSAAGYPAQPDGAGAVDPVRALRLAASGPPGAANAGLTPVAAGRPAVAAAEAAAGSWQQGYWDQGYWDQGYWDQGYWDQGYWD
jgi:serine protease AprX